MSITPPNPGPGRLPQARTDPRRMITGLVLFVVGLLIVAGAVVFVLVSFVGSNPIALVPGLLIAFVGIAVNVTGLTLIYRAISNSVPKDPGGPRETP